MADEKQNLLLELSKAEELSQSVDKMSIHVQELEHKEKEAARREGELWIFLCVTDMEKLKGMGFCMRVKNE